MNKTNEQPNVADNRAARRSLRKPRSDSRWNSLTRKQLETVEQWLLEERISYAETAVRLKKEFGMEISLMGISRFYRERALVRRSIETVEAQVDADKLGALPVKTEDLRAGAVKLLAKNAVALGVERPEDMAGLVSLTKVLLKGERNEIRLRKVKLGERYYDFESNTMGAKELQKVRGYLRTVGENDNLSLEEKLGAGHRAFVREGQDKRGEAGKRGRKRGKRAQDLAEETGGVCCPARRCNHPEKRRCSSRRRDRERGATKYERRRRRHTGKHCEP